MDLLLSLLRTYVQAAVAALAAYLTYTLGLALPADWSTTLEAVVWGLIAAGFVAGLRFLETRRGDSFPARLARLVAVVLTAGLAKRQPTYSAPRASTMDVDNRYRADW